MWTNIMKLFSVQWSFKFYFELEWDSLLLFCLNEPMWTDRFVLLIFLYFSCSIIRIAHSFKMHFISPCSWRVIFTFSNWIQTKTSSSITKQTVNRSFCFWSNAFVVHKCVLLVCAFLEWHYFFIKLGYVCWFLLNL